MTPFRGIIFTHLYHLEQAQKVVEWGGYDAVHVSAGWGLDEGWSDASRRFMAGLTPQLCLRGTGADPSYGDGAKSLPDANDLYQEVAPWYAIKPDLWLLIGNEPNYQRWATDEDYIWEYQALLIQVAVKFKTEFPRAKLVAPALLIDSGQGGKHTYRRWLDLCAEAFQHFHAVGVHIYEHDAFLAEERRHGSTEQLAAVAKFYPKVLRGKPIVVTEFGINDAATSEPVKGQRYAALIRRKAATPVLPEPVAGYLAYHVCAREDIDPNYCLHRLGHEAFRRAMVGN